MHAFAVYDIDTLDVLRTGYSMLMSDVPFQETAANEAVKLISGHFMPDELYIDPVTFVVRRKADGQGIEVDW